MSERTLEVERAGAAAWVWMNRPAAHNALNDAMIDELAETFLDLREDHEVRVIVLSGRGKSFSAGGDIEYMKRQGSAPRESNLASARVLAEMFRVIANSPQPTIARVNGAALGGGLGLIAVCDIAIASSTAVFAASEVRLGLIPSTIAPYVLLAIGARQATRLFQTGERIDAEHAQRIGLVHEIAEPDQLDARLQSIVTDLLAGAPGAQSAAKRLMDTVGNRPITRELMEETAVRIADLRSQPEAQEGLSAFLEKAAAGLDAAKMMPATFETILIANRGEIACRIMATCRRMGIRAIAVYSDADAKSRHVRIADKAVRIGRPPARESYLDIDRIIEAARKTGAQAIHPGYGFLSENADFAEACARDGIVFIGPPPAAIRAMGSKAAAKELMRQAGVPLTPGYDGTNQEPAFLEQQAEAIAYPIMIKANAGGGGKGMRRVDAREQFQAALAACRREAASAFGDDSVLLEKYVVAPRHVEVQVFGDTRGNILSLFERDCSVQRRHQKVIEEAPASLITHAQREALGEAARDAARAVGYVSAGTVEFLFDRDGNFYFMEMNTRLQVEHPVTEMVTRLDLVEWQLRVAAGEPLPWKQEELTMRGHAIEARIYAEDPNHDFLPSIGQLVHLRPPASTEHVRIDSGVEQGDAITPFYDPMIAKLIVWDETRELAVRRMQSALAEYQIVGVANNVFFLHRLVTSPSFTAAKLDTGLIEREKEWIWTKAATAPDRAIILAALGVALRDREVAKAAGRASSPWARGDGWRLNGTYTRRLVFAHADREYVAVVEYGATSFRVSVGQSSRVVSGEPGDNGRIDAVINGERVTSTVIFYRGHLHVFLEGQSYVFAYVDPLDVAAEGHSKESSLLAPMPGRMIAQIVPPGEPVEKGAPLMVLEAMKMECTIHAPAAGKVEAFHFAVGDQVTEGAELLRFDREETQADESV